MRLFLLKIFAFLLFISVLYGCGESDPPVEMPEPELSDEELLDLCARSGCMALLVGFESVFGLASPAAFDGLVVVPLLTSWLPFGAPAGSVFSWVQPAIRPAAMRMERWSFIAIWGKSVPGPVGPWA